MYTINHNKLKGCCIKYLIMNQKCPMISIFRIHSFKLNQNYKSSMLIKKTKHLCSSHDRVFQVVNTPVETEYHTCTDISIHVFSLVNNYYKSPLQDPPNPLHMVTPPFQKILDYPPLSIFNIHNMVPPHMRCSHFNMGPEGEICIGRSFNLIQNWLDYLVTRFKLQTV